MFDSYWENNHINYVLPNSCIYGFMGRKNIKSAKMASFHSSVADRTTNDVK